MIKLQPTLQVRHDICHPLIQSFGLSFFSKITKPLIHFVFS
jgi:hypothetical protein